MNRKSIFVILLALMLLSLMPVAALAGGHAEVKVFVRNHTDGTVEMRLTDASGVVSFHTLPAGVSSFELAEGNYTYFASTLCGNQSGPFNANQNKTLYLGCDGAPVVLYDQCQFVAKDVLRQNEYFDPYSFYQDAQRHGITWSYEYLIGVLKYYDIEYSCVYGVLPEDYRDGHRPQDEKPNYMQ